MTGLVPKKKVKKDDLWEQIFSLFYLPFLFNKIPLVGLSVPIKRYRLCSLLTVMECKVITETPY